MEQVAAEVAAMRRAIALAALGTATTRPNPTVGCVILAPDGSVISEGWHERPGGPHAEIGALRGAGERARGATAVVTLEPCAHTGRTGPCAEALRRAGIARVVYAVVDPTPQAGGGAQILRRAGVTVVGGLLADEAGRQNERWLTAVRRSRPFTIWKYAATLDGRSAAADWTSRWITGPEARADVHRLRADADAVLAGIGTVLADDPRLTVRSPDGTLAGIQPLRVVVDSAGRTPPAARVRDDAAATWIATAAEVGSGPDGHVDLAALAAELYRRGVQVALLEGGPRLAAAFLRAGLVDRVIGYVAPALLGGGPPALADAGVSTLADAWRLELVETAVLGADVRITARMPERSRTSVHRNR